MYHLMIFAKWLFLAGAVFLAGAFAARILITALAVTDDVSIKGDNRSFGYRASRFLFTLSIIALITHSIHLVLHCSIMTETPLRDVFTSVLPAYITKTRNGKLALVRTLLLFTVAVISLSMLRVKDKRKLRNRTLYSFHGLVFVLITLSLSGHQGIQGDITVPFFIDLAHIVALSLWIGGLMFLRVCYSPFFSTYGIEKWPTFLSMINRFSDIATNCVFLVLVTGITMSVINIHGFSTLFTSPYGTALGIKAALVGLLLSVGGINKFFLIPGLNKVSNEKPETKIALQRKLKILMTTEMALGLCILLNVSYLIHLMPGA
jgi:putative copper export protein